MTFLFQTYTKSLDCILLLLPHIIKQKDKKETRLTDLVFILQKHLCGIAWEQREATLAFLQKALINYKGEDIFSVCIGNSEISIRFVNDKYIYESHQK